MTDAQHPGAPNGTGVVADHTGPTEAVRRVLGPIRHETFTEARHLDADPSAVFSAFADPMILRRWFKLPGLGATCEHDFQVGGGDRANSTMHHLDGTEERLEYRSRYIHIVKDRQIVYGYESLVDDVLCWTSLVSIQLDAVEDGTQLEWTEQVAYFVITGDGSVDLPHLRGAIRLRLNGLPIALATTA
jgi:uncharacterized protein YndB with AHSA1/START domain